MGSLLKPNASAATLTKNRTEDSVVSLSGMCVTCVDGCIGMCEIGKSAYRGHEVIYPQPFGIITTASQKAYPIDLSHFHIMGTAVGAAMAGVPLTIGENVCAMDVDSRIVKDKAQYSPDLERRVKLYKQWQRDGYGAIIVQANVEDDRLGVLEYAIEKLGADGVELKWGQGAKDIGGEGKINRLEKAQLLRKRHYIVLPDPLDPFVVKEFHNGDFTEFERHSRVGMVTEEGFLKRVKH